MSTAVSGDAPNQPQPMQAPPQKSGGSKWLIPMILAVMGIPLLCCVGCFMFGGSVLLLTKAPWDAAVNAAKADPTVQQRLGTPIEASANNYQSSIENSTAEVGADLTGPNGSARVEGTMTKVGDTWSPTALTVTYDDQSKSTIP